MEKAESAEELAADLKKKLKYGIRYSDGTYETSPDMWDKRDVNDIVVQTPEELDESGIGMCHDVTRALIKALRKRRIRHVAMMLKGDAEPRLPTHSFVVSGGKGKYTVLDPLSYDTGSKGEYKSIDEAVADRIADWRKEEEKGNVTSARIPRRDWKNRALLDFLHYNGEKKAGYEYEDIDDESVARHKKGYRNAGRIRLLKTTRGTFILKDGKLAGFVNTERKDDGRTWVQALEVAPEFRRQGIARKLLAKAVDDYGATDLTVRKTNQAARKLYDSEGWVPYKEEGIMEFRKKAQAYEPPWTIDQIRENLGDETADRLAKDPVHRWRSDTGIELVHKEPTKKELRRIIANWRLMSDAQKRLSDEKSRELFGVTNEENARRLLGKRRRETYESGEGEVESYTPDKTEDHDEIVIRTKDGRRIRISNNTKLGKLLKARKGSMIGYHGYRVDGTNVVHKVHPNAHSRGGWLEEKAAMSRDRIQAQYARHPQESLERLAKRLAGKKWGKRDVAREDAAHAEEFGITGEDKEYLDRYIIARIAERYDRKARLKQALMRALWEKGHNGESFDAALPARMARFRQYEGSPFGRYDNPIEQAKYDEWASKSDEDMDAEWEKYLKN